MGCPAGILKDQADILIGVLLDLAAVVTALFRMSSTTFLIGLPDKGVCQYPAVDG